MVFLDFEKPLENLYEQLEKLRQVGEEGVIDVTENIKELEKKIQTTKKDIYANLTGWQRVQLSRHPERPYTLFYIDQMCKKFTELHGDRYCKDDKAIVGGIAKIDTQSVVILGHQKGINTKIRQYRNFGMANPDGYRKALRLMKLAERFNLPVISLIDTPGAFPGLEAEERGQAEAIARNLFEMAQLKVWVTKFLCWKIHGTPLFHRNHVRQYSGEVGILRKLPLKRLSLLLTICLSSVSSMISSKNLLEEHILILKKWPKP